MVHPAIPRVITSDFFSGRDHEVELFEVPSDKRAAALPLLLHRDLEGGVLDDHAVAGLTTRRFEVNGTCFHALVEPLPQQVWATLPLPDHRFVPHGAQHDEPLRMALEHLADNHPVSFSTLRTFVTDICWIDLVPEQAGAKYPITSATSPTLPFVVFISEQAIRHIPPVPVFPEGSFRLLAENLAHEAAHQMTNVHLLEEDVFIPEYDAASAPKIEIAWRKDRSDGDRWFEVDRALQATVVYADLVRFRLREVQDPTLTPRERGFFLQAADSGVKAFRYIAGSLLDHREQFTEHGYGLVRGLVDQAETAVREWAELQPRLIA